MVIIRKTYGFQKDSDKISFTTIQKLTGLSRSAVNDGIKDLGPLLKITHGSENSRGMEGVNEYSLILEYSGNWAEWYEKHTSTKKHLRLVRKSYSPKQSTSKQSKDTAEKLKQSELQADQEFEKAWSLYPKRSGGNSKTEAYKAWKTWVHEGVDPYILKSKDMQSTSGPPAKREPNT